MVPKEIEWRIRAARKLQMAVGGLHTDLGCDDCRSRKIEAWLCVAKLIGAHDKTSGQAWLAKNRRLLEGRPSWQKPETRGISKVKLLKMHREMAMDHARGSSLRSHPLSRRSSTDCRPLHCVASARYEGSSGSGQGGPLAGSRRHGSDGWLGEYLRSRLMARGCLVTW